MYDLLNGIRLIEGAAFVAAPLCGLTFVQLGADVIRFDAIGGGPDYRRWPLAAGGSSYYWEGLNKGKRSIAIDLSRPEGRELATALITAPGEDSGYFVTNYPANGFLAHDRLAALRADLISVRVTGSSDGRNAVDYTVNCAAGYPDMTGPPTATEPVNHVLPAWDIATGLYAATALLAAGRDRRRTSRGREIAIPLSNVAFGMLGNLGLIAEVAASGADRPRYGNALFGAFGSDFVCADGRRLMIVALTKRQWTGLLDVLAIGNEVVALEQQHGVDFTADEGARFIHRDALFALAGERIARLSFADLTARLDQAGVTWGPYQTVRQALATDPRLSTANPMFASVRHPSGASYLTPGFPGMIATDTRRDPRPAPRLGEHTDEILSTILNLSGGEVARLHDAGVVAAAKEQQGA
ncbi:MAG: CoA transferase [Xanthobacteraceae bacterium]